MAKKVDDDGDGEKESSTATIINAFGDWQLFELAVCPCQAKITEFSVYYL